MAFCALAETPPRPTYLVSQIIHNPLVNEELRRRGIRFLFDARGRRRVPESQVHGTDAVLIPAFGTTLHVEASLRRSGIDTGTRRVAMAQAGFAPIAALLGGMVAGLEAALAVLYGMLVALAASAVLVWRERQSMQHPEWDQHRLFKLFIRTSVERLVLLVGLLIVGLGALKLAPLPLLLGLVLAQFAWLAAATGRSNNKK